MKGQGSLLEAVSSKIGMLSVAETGYITLGTETPRVTIGMGLLHKKTGVGTDYMRGLAKAISQRRLRRTVCHVSQPVIGNQESPATRGKRDWVHLLYSNACSLDGISVHTKNRGGIISYPLLLKYASCSFVTNQSFTAQSSPAARNCPSSPAAAPPSPPHRSRTPCCPTCGSPSP